MKGSCVLWNQETRATMRSAYMGLGLYGFSGYKGNFCVGPNGMGIFTIDYFGFKDNF